MQPVMDLLPLTPRISTSVRLDCMQRRVMAVEDVGYISKNKLVSSFLLPSKLNIGKIVRDILVKMARKLEY